MHVVTAVGLVNDRGAQRRDAGSAHRHDERVAAHGLRVAVAVDSLKDERGIGARDGRLRAHAAELRLGGARATGLHDRRKRRALDVRAVNGHGQLVLSGGDGAVRDGVGAVSRVEHGRLQACAAGLLDKGAHEIGEGRAAVEEHRLDGLAARGAVVAARVARAHHERVDLARDAQRRRARHAVDLGVQATHHGHGRMRASRAHDGRVRRAEDWDLVVEHLDRILAGREGRVGGDVHPAEQIGHLGMDRLWPTQRDAKVAPGGCALGVAVRVLREDLELGQRARDRGAQAVAKGRRVARTRHGGEGLHAKGRSLDVAFVEGDRDVVQAGGGDRVLDEVRAVARLGHDAAHARAARDAVTLCPS